MLVSKIRTLAHLIGKLDRIPIIEGEVRELREKVSANDGLKERTEELAGQVSRLAAQIDRVSSEIMRDAQLRGGRLDLELKDLKRALIGARFAPPDYYLKSDHPVALSSNDHRIPRGTINDDTRWPRFCKKAERIFEGRRIRFLDIGCAGGGLVFDFLARGHDAVGIEGSDINWLTERAHWGVIPDRLFTCDAAQPYRFLSVHGDRPIRFDLISSWEVLEHIPEDSLGQFFRNIKEHLAEKGLFVASVATFEDRDSETGAVWHVTVKTRAWWLQKLAQFELEPVEASFVHEDFVRGAGNPFAADWDAMKNPEMGFHIVATHARRSHPHE